MTGTDALPERTITVREPRAVPWLSIVLGYGPMLPFLGGAAAAWWLDGDARRLMVSLTVSWACAILLFLSGVRRGVSFCTEGGARVSQIVTMFFLFCLGFAALVAQAFGKTTAAIGLLLAGYAGVAVLDPIAARRGEAPLFFARLRPFQIPLAILGLLALLCVVLTR